MGTKLRNLKVIRSTDRDSMTPLITSAEELARKLPPPARCLVCDRRIDTYLRRLYHRFVCDYWK